MDFVLRGLRNWLTSQAFLQDSLQALGENLPWKARTDAHANSSHPPENRPEIHHKKLIIPFQFFLVNKYPVEVTLSLNISYLSSNVVALCRLTTSFPTTMPCLSFALNFISRPSRVPARCSTPTRTFPTAFESEPPLGLLLILLITHCL